MAKVCYFTGRKTRSANNRSHAMNATKRTVKPNLQKVRVLVDGKPKKVWVSTRALKSGKVERVSYYPIKQYQTVQLRTVFLFLLFFTESKVLSSLTL